MRRHLLAMLAVLAGLASPAPVMADQSGGCMPTTGTYTGLQAANYINAGFSSIFSSSSGASPPSNPCGGNPVKGQFWLNTSSPTLQTLNVYNGSQWMTIGTLDLSGNSWVLPPFPSQLKAFDGTLALPGISFNNEPATGMRRAAVNDLRLTVGGVDQITITPTAVTVNNLTAMPLGQVQLQKVGSNLALVPYDGNQLTINGVNRTVPAAGVTLVPGGLANATLYYIYAFMSGSAIALEASPTSHVASSNGIRVKSGDASRTLVGMAQLSGGAFFDTVTIRYTASWFNRLPRSMAAYDCCGSIAISQQTLATYDSNARIYFLSWGGVSTQLSSIVPYDLPDNGVINYTLYTAVAIDGSVIGGSQYWLGLGYHYVPVTSVGNLFHTASHVGSVTLAEGAHYVEPAAAVASGGAAALSIIQTSGTVWQ